MSNFSLVRGAEVKLTQIANDKGLNVAQIVVNDTFTHRFPATSRISKHLDVMKASDLEERLNGGTYFFVDDKMVDMRDGAYDGFVHDDSAISKFMDLLGYQPVKDLPRHRGHRGSDGSDIVLRKVWCKNEILVPGYATGGEFTTELSFVWNPFVKTLNSSFDLVRLICTNGMIGLTSFLNTKVPLMNRWEEHLDIASRQIQNKVNTIVVSRVQNMTSERASVADCMLLEQHAFNRLSASNAIDMQPTERERLKNLLTAVAPKFHLHNTYQDAVFEDKNLASQLPGHLSNFDAFNIATELRSHTKQNAKSSDNALDKFANSILFDYDSNVVAGATRYNAPALSSFSSPERAFFGSMN